MVISTAVDSEVKALTRPTILKVVFANTMVHVSYTASKFDTDSNLKFGYGV